MFFVIQNGLTALHLACCNGQLEIVKLLLEKSKEQQQFHKKKNDEPANDQQVAINASLKSNVCLSELSHN